MGRSVMTQALRLGPREEAGGILPTQGRWCAHHREDHSALGSKAGEMRPRTPEGLMVEGTTKVTLKVLGEEEGGGRPEKSGSRGAELEGGWSPGAS